MSVNKDGRWVVYILLCSRDASLYTGITIDIDRRVRAHSGEIAGGAKYTRSRRPVTLVYEEEVADRTAAFFRELAIKRMTREDKLRLIEKHKEKKSAQHHAEPDPR